MQRTKRRCRGRVEGEEDEERIQRTKRGCRGLRENADDEERCR
jgi:hypothetical protein